MDPSRIDTARSDGGPILVHVETYPPAGLDRRSHEVAEFRAAAAARLVPGVALLSGPDDVAPGIVAPLVGFAFREEHIPQPYEDILAWLRQHELVRLIEIERTVLAGDATRYAVRTASRDALSDTAWARLRAAAPSFLPRWNAFVNDAEVYDATLAYANITLLVEHLAERARQGDWSELPPVFDTLEQLLVQADKGLCSLLTTGFLEELQRDFEEFDPQLRRLSQLIRGARTHSAWESAWNYRHPPR